MCAGTFSCQPRPPGAYRRQRRRRCHGQEGGGEAAHEASDVCDEAVDNIWITPSQGLVIIGLLCACEMLAWALFLAISFPRLRPRPGFPVPL